jgi:hypothetical protein
MLNTTGLLPAKQAFFIAGVSGSFVSALIEESRTA